MLCAEDDLDRRVDVDVDVHVAEVPPKSPPLYALLVTKTTSREQLPCTLPISGRLRASDAWVVASRVDDDIEQPDHGDVLEVPALCFVPTTLPRSNRAFAGEEPSAADTVRDAKEHAKIDQVLELEARSVDAFEDDDGLGGGALARRVFAYGRPPAKNASPSRTTASRVSESSAASADLPAPLRPSSATT